MGAHLCHRNRPVGASFTAPLNGILCEVFFFGGSALFLFYGVGAMASCDYIPEIMLSNVF